MQTKAHLTVAIYNIMHDFVQKNSHSDIVGKIDQTKICFSQTLKGNLMQSYLSVHLILTPFQFSNYLNEFCKKIWYRIKNPFRWGELAYSPASGSYSCMDITNTSFCVVIAHPGTVSNPVLLG